MQQKRFISLDELVSFYSLPKRGIVCALTTPIEPPRSVYDDDDDDDDDDGNLSLSSSLSFKSFVSSFSLPPTFNELA